MRILNKMYLDRLVALTVILAMAGNILLLLGVAFGSGSIVRLGAALIAPAAALIVMAIVIIVPIAVLRAWREGRLRASVARSVSLEGCTFLLAVPAGLGAVLMIVAPTARIGWLGRIGVALIAPFAVLTAFLMIVVIPILAFDNWKRGRDRKR